MLHILEASGEDADAVEGEGQPLTRTLSRRFSILPSWASKANMDLAGSTKEEGTRATGEEIPAIAGDSQVDIAELGHPEEHGELV